MIVIADPWKTALKEHIDYKEAQRDEIISPAGRKEFDLAEARKHNVSSKQIKLFLFSVLGASLIKDVRDKSKVN